jgi:hypothetical protein
MFQIPPAHKRRKNLCDTMVSYLLQERGLSTSVLDCVAGSCSSEGLLGQAHSCFLLWRIPGQVEVRKPHPDSSLWMFLCGFPQPPRTYSFQFLSASFLFHYLQMDKEKKLTKEESFLK